MMPLDFLKEITTHNYITCIFYGILIKKKIKNIKNKKIIYQIEQKVIFRAWQKLIKNIYFSTLNIDVDTELHYYF